MIPVSACRPWQVDRSGLAGDRDASQGLPLNGGRECALDLIVGRGNMKLSRDYFDFVDKMDTHYPRFGEQYRFDFDLKQDDGKGL